MCRVVVMGLFVKTWGFGEDGMEGMETDCTGSFLLFAIFYDFFLHVIGIFRVKRSNLI
jgi:hypothetical protein